MTYKAYDVWRRLRSTSAIRYRCFEDLETPRFCIQSSDTVTLPLAANGLSGADRIYAELLIEQAPEERAHGWSDSIRGAIEKHENLFGPDEEDLG